MLDLLTPISTFITTVFEEWVPLVVSIVIAEPVLTMFVVAIPVVGLAVGLFNRLIRSN